jgi:hypothetical protein
MRGPLRLGKDEIDAIPARVQAGEIVHRLTLDHARPSATLSHFELNQTHIVSSF